MSFYIAQTLGFIASLINIVSIQIKEKTKILFCFILANLFFAINFALLSSYTGAIICFISAIQTLIKYLLDKKQKEFPKFLIPIYIIIAIISGGITYQKFIDIIPIIAAVLYIITILQKNEKNLRLTMFINIVLWLVYDIFVQAYTAILSDGFFTISNIIAIYRYDIRKNPEEKINNNKEENNI